MNLYPRLQWHQLSAHDFIQLFSLSESHHDQLTKKIKVPEHKKGWIIRSLQQDSCHKSLPERMAQVRDLPVQMELVVDCFPF